MVCSFFIVTFFSRKYLCFIDFLFRIEGRKNSDVKTKKISGLPPRIKGIYMDEALSKTSEWQNTDLNNIEIMTIHSIHYNMIFLRWKSQPKWQKIVNFLTQNSESLTMSWFSWVEWCWMQSWWRHVVLLSCFQFRSAIWTCRPVKKGSWELFPSSA